MGKDSSGVLRDVEDRVGTLRPQKRLQERDAERTVLRHMQPEVVRGYVAEADNPSLHHLLGLRVDRHGDRRDILAVRRIGPLERRDLARPKSPERRIANSAAYRASSSGSFCPTKWCSSGET
jgi:hypothetical protein